MAMVVVMVVMIMAEVVVTVTVVFFFHLPLQGILTPTCNERGAPRRALPGLAVPYRSLPCSTVTHRPRRLASARLG